jgi:hypothetical protein
MIQVWFSRLFGGGNGRMAALESEVAELRAELGNLRRQVPLAAGRTQAPARDRSGDPLRDAAFEAASPQESAENDHDEIVRLRTQLLRVDRELRHGFAQAAAAAEGLLQRIESVRRAQTGTENAVADVTQSVRR